MAYEEARHPDLHLQVPLIIEKSLALLERLRLGPAELRAALAPGLVVHELRNGVAIQAGDVAEPGDRNRRDTLPLVRSVASVIEPVQHVQTVGIFGFEEVQEFVDWQRRHLL